MEVKELEDEVEGLRTRLTNSESEAAEMEDQDDETGEETGEEPVDDADAGLRPRADARHRALRAGADAL